MKKFFLNLMVVAIAATVVLSSCDKKSETQDAIDVLLEQGVLRGNLKHEVTLNASKTYSLAGAFVVESGGVLNIPAGTTIKADEGFGNYILVAQGGKIYANGTASQPITLTSASSSAKAGAWGGLIINGYAPLTSGQASASTEINADYKYGGTNASDNSGSLNYVKIMYSGARSSGDIEHNGLTLNGVGSGTKIENIYVYECADDGIEFFGGSVNVTNLLCVNTDDDMFDFTQGYNGTLKNAYGIWETGFTSTESDPRGIEADGNFDGNFSTDNNQSNFTVENITIDLRLAFDAGKATQMQDAFKIRRGAKATIKNALVKGIGSVGDLVDMNDGKGAGDPTSSISVTVQLTKGPDDAANPARQLSGTINTLNVVDGNTGCPTDIFTWTGYKF